MANNTPYFKGLAYILKGDPTQASGAGMVDLKQTFQVEINLNPSTSSASEPGGAQLADSVNTRPVNPTIAIEYHKSEAALMAALCDSLKVNATSQAGLDLVDETEYTDPETLCVVPVNEVEGAIDSDGVWWFPAVHAEDISALTYNDQEGTDAQNNYTVTLRSTKRYTDQAETALPKGSRMGWRGKPADHGSLTWSLPTPYAAAV